MTEIFTITLKNQIFSSLFSSSDMKFCMVLHSGSCKRKRHYWYKYKLKIKRNELWYLENEFRIKKRHFLELPEINLTNKFVSDKFVGKKKSYSLENDFGGKTWETKYWQFTSICLTKNFFLVEHAPITVQTHR